MRLVETALILSLAALSGSSAVAATKFVPKFNEAGVPELRFAPRSADGSTESVENRDQWSGSAEVEVLDGEAVVTFTLRRVVPGGSADSQQGWKFVWRVKLAPTGSETI